MIPFLPKNRNHLFFDWCCQLLVIGNGHWIGWGNSTVGSCWWLILINNLHKNSFFKWGFMHFLNGRTETIKLLTALLKVIYWQLAIKDWASKLVECFTMIIACFPSDWGFLNEGKICFELFQVFCCNLHNLSMNTPILQRLRLPTRHYSIVGICSVIQFCCQKWASILYCCGLPIVTPKNAS